MIAPDPVRVAADRLRADCGLPRDPGRRGPVPLDRCFAESGLDHVALPHLTIGVLTGYLAGRGIRAELPGQADDPLAGFLFVAGAVGWAFVRADDILPRRRFTAAHELGHYVLHRQCMGGQFLTETNETVLETADTATAARMEREANRFAGELLLPEAVCRARAAELQRAYGCCPEAVLVSRLAGELLVSREATRYRVQALGICQ